MFRKRLFKSECQAEHDRTSRRIEGKVLVQRAVVLFVEYIVDADTRLYYEVAETVEGMASIEAPDAVTRSISVCISRIVDLALNTTVQVDVQGVVAPTVYVVSGDGSCMAHTAFDVLPFASFVQTASVGVCVISGQGESGEQIAVEVYFKTFDGGFVEVEVVLHTQVLGGREIANFGKLLAQLVLLGKSSNLVDLEVTMLFT